MSMDLNGNGNGDVGGEMGAATGVAINGDKDVAEARRAARELFADKLAAGWQPRALDTYRAADGAVLFHRVRFDAPPGSDAEKFIRPIHHDGSGWRVGEPPVPPQGKALFRLPQLLQAHPLQPVYVVEGEKAARAPLRLGLVVTTSGGASSAASADWSPLRGRRVRIWPDHDGAGARYGEEVGALTKVYAASVQMLDLGVLRLPQKGDAHDWERANPGAVVADVEVLPWRPWQPGGVKPPPPDMSIPRLRTICAADIVPQPVRWLWPGRIAIGKLTVIAGDPGLGKSMLSVRLATHVSRGTPWPVDGAPCLLGSVLIVSSEDEGEDTIRPRLDAAGADSSRVEILETVDVPHQGERSLSLQRHMQSVAVFLEEHPDVRLVCLDPICSFLGEVDSHKNADVRALLQPLGKLASKYRVAIVAIAHLNKSGAGGSPAIYRVSGSMAFVAAARAAFMVTKDKADPSRRLVVPIKNNLGPDTGGVAYRIGVGDNGVFRVDWDDQPVTLSADEALSQVNDSEGEADAMDAAGWLRELLSAGSLPVRQIQAEAQNIGIPWRKVQRALKPAGGETVREGFGRDASYIWRLRTALNGANVSRLQ